MTKGYNMLRELQLELSTHCNSNCTMCLRDKLIRKKGTMSTEFAFDIINQCSDMGVKLLKPQWFGESLLTSEWRPITTYAMSRGMRIMLITNGSLMDEQNRTHALKVADKVFFSIDSHHKKDYENIRRGLKFDEVIDNLKKLYKERNDSNSETKIYVTAVLL